MNMLMYFAGKKIKVQVKVKHFLVLFLVFGVCQMDEEVVDKNVICNKKIDGEKPKKTNIFNPIQPGL